MSELLSLKKNNLLRILEKEAVPAEILRAFRKIEREKFVPKDIRDFSYNNTALPIGYGQTISQPSTTAFMLKLLELREDLKILEIGSGSGYVLALLSELTRAGEIFGVEIVPELIASSRKILKKYKNIKVYQASKRLGLKSRAPFDRILLSASAKSFPSELFLQLRDGGVVVCPVQNSIVKMKKDDGNLVKNVYPGFVFVPLLV